jgi:hypothetical protein
MPHHFEFNFEHRILRLVLEGNIEGGEFLCLHADIRVHAQRLLPLAGIADATAIENFNVTSQNLRSAAMQGSPYPDTTPRYIIAPTDYLFGMARMYELVGNHSEGKLQVVRKLEEALADMGVAQAKFEQVSS